MKPLLIAAVALPLALGTCAAPASADSRTGESTSESLAATHYRCTSTKDD